MEQPGIELKLEEAQECEIRHKSVIQATPQRRVRMNVDEVMQKG
jgi:hypothetical protein